MKKVFENTFFIAFVATLLILFELQVIEQVTDKSNPLGSMSGFLGFLVADVSISFVVGLAVAFLAYVFVLTGKCILFFLAFIRLFGHLALPDNEDEDASSTKTKLDKGVVLFGLAILAILAYAFFTSDGTSKAAVVVVGIACSVVWVFLAYRTRIICERKFE